MYDHIEQILNSSMQVSFSSPTQKGRKLLPETLGVSLTGDYNTNDNWGFFIDLDTSEIISNPKFNLYANHSKSVLPSIMEEGKSITRKKFKLVRNTMVNHIINIPLSNVLICVIIYMSVKWWI